MFALIDCNNFFVSCERVFEPKLKNEPVVVLSNNDGCVIARSNEAKQIGIPMGAPAFKYKDLFLNHNVTVFSSNFSLYGDFSNRIRSITSQFGFPIEIYSIDEMFIELPILPKDKLETLCQTIKQRIAKWTGIPVSIGIAKTKTLAKLASHLAKKNLKYQGVLAIIETAPYLKTFPVENIWGIGRQFSSSLKNHRIRFAKDLVAMPDPLIRKLLKVGGLKTVMELRGIPCLTLNEVRSPRKSIVSSRSFGKEIDSKELLKQAIASFIEIGAQKLRLEKLQATHLGVFIATNRFGKTPYYSNAHYLDLPLGSSYAPDLNRYGEICLNVIYKKGLSYKRAGIFLGSLVSSVQWDLFSKDKSSSKKDKVASVMDQINQKYQNKSIHFAAEGTQKKWQGRRAMRSPNYTTSFDESLTVILD
ncbi:MAG: Y-family DNA polymerase [Simkaniaceae bacterium]|nr:Y-family DNA polymerase [Simkaniaceae bacterium]